MRLKAIALAGLLTSVPAFAEDKVVVRNVSFFAIRVQRIILL